MLLNTALQQITAIKLLEDCARTVLLRLKNKNLLESFHDIKRKGKIEPQSNPPLHVGCTNLFVLAHIKVPVSRG